MTSDDLVTQMRSWLEEKKAEDIVVIDMRPHNFICDFMVIAHGSSNRQIRAMGAFIGKNLKELGISARMEGLSGSDWVLIDATDILVHLFKPEGRHFYNIEKMWAPPSMPKDAEHFSVL